MQEFQGKQRRLNVTPFGSVSKRRHRDLSCPICGSTTELLLAFSFGRRLDLPTATQLRFCAADAFSFITDIKQKFVQRIL